MLLLQLRTGRYDDTESVAENLRRELIKRSGSSETRYGGVLVSQSLDVLFQVGLGSSPRLCLPVSLGESMISRRTVMNGAKIRTTG